jgi:cobalt/nickel transport system ATP-binding protein
MNQNHQPVPVIEFRNVSYAYPNGPLSLKGISFSLEKGSKVALVGPNGAGKTTLLLMCNGILRPKEGEVLLSGLPVSYDSSSLREVRKKVGFVFQNSDNQLFAPTVYQDVAFGPLNLGLPEDKIRDSVTRTLYAVGLTGYEKRPPHHLSGGEKKRVAIAGVLAMEPEILVFDEPTSSLDPAGGAEIMDLLDELNEQGTTIILSTHDVDLAYHWADQVILMAGGGILHQGRPESVFTDQGMMRAARLTMPPLLELYMELSARKILSEENPPAGVLGLTQAIEAAAGGRSSIHPAAIYLCDADTCSGRILRAMIEDQGIGHVGAMGTRAKMRAEEEGIPVDFTYGVIDKSLLKAMLGEKALIITSGGMLARVRERVAKFAEESGFTIPVIPAGE